MNIEREKKVKVVYRNWKGVTSERTIIPGKVFFGSNEYHSEPQWLLECLDVEKAAGRTFAMADIQSWRPA